MHEWPTVLMLLIPTCAEDLQDAVWEEGLKQHQQSNPPKPQSVESLAVKQMALQHFNIGADFPLKL